MEDTPIFREEMASAERRQPPGLGVLIRDYWRPLLVVGGLVVALNVVNYSLLSYMPTYLQRRTGLSNEEALLVPIVGLLFMLLFLPFAGALYDRVGRRGVWRWSLIGMRLPVVPLYMLIGTGLTRALTGFTALAPSYGPQHS